MPGLLLSMIKELPFTQRSAEYMPLSRVQIYSAEDDSMSLNMFVYGDENKQLTRADVALTGEDERVENRAWKVKLNVIKGSK